MNFYLKKELFDLIIKEAKLRSVPPEYVLQESFNKEYTTEYNGPTRVIKTDKFIQLPKGYMGKLSLHCVVKSYERVWAKQVYDVIKDWPRMTNNTFVLRMKEAFPNVHPAVWHLREIRKDNIGDFHLYQKYGAVSYRSLHFDNRWNNNFQCEVLR